MKKFFSPSPLWQQKGISIIRIIVGLFLIYHGWEIFDSATMNEYLKYDNFKGSSYPSFMVYAGKAGELIAGFLLLIGWLTRLASVAIIITFLYISFFVGHGKIWYEDQHPFLFVLLALVFIFTGPGKWSIDNLLFYIKTRITKNIL
jgi:uncharacterized membrane protein YphA (DoxX/SURF4 family)